MVSINTIKSITKNQKHLLSYKTILRATAQCYGIAQQYIIFDSIV